MGTKVINNSEVKSALKIPGVAGTLVAAAAMKIAGFDKMNAIYSHISQYNGSDFADHLIEYLGVTVDVNSKALETIPKTGSLIVVSNHPFGGIDGMIAVSILSKIRPDIKVLTNFILSQIPNMKEQFLPVNPFTDKANLRSSFRGIKGAEEHLANGGVLVLFPAGEVSSNDNEEGVVKDIEWQPSIIKMIKRANVPVLPVYFHGTNSAYFHFLGKISPKLRTLRLPGELNNKKGKTIHFRIGGVIPVEEIADYKENKSLGAYLRSRTYALEANLKSDVSREYTVPLIAPASVDNILSEFNDSPDSKLFQVGQFSCYLFDYKNIPAIMQEIGLRREEAFRFVGEGTNKESDTDEYDKYYKHLVLWDNSKNELAGAYRLGIGSEIIKEYGIKGFYTDSLFCYKQEFSPLLNQSVELGRSFVAKNYQKDTLALLLLLKGLLYAMLRYRDVKCLIGPVSISSWYPAFYRSAMIYYLRLKQYIPEYSALVSPKNPFVPDFGRVDIEALLSKKMDNLETFDRFIFKISVGQYRLPTLLKKYLRLNAKIINFNVDPDFNDCVDGLIMLNLNDMPTDDIDGLSKEFVDSGKDDIYRRFYGDTY
ncbi:MAG: lysophospholipid acyltransferase family protein [Bacteroidales bacterium]|jgi:putative hemolysin|nr:lysophospholipid acyltransferase family protein [Bacteroidales bacterium]MCI1732763.1 lysophospholipid acyltransferase family protein [Bacteroidales bacterium]